MEFQSKISCPTSTGGSYRCATPGNRGGDGKKLIRTGKGQRKRKGIELTGMSVVAYVTDWCARGKETQKFKVTVQKGGEKIILA